jgi:hypothetical protein
VRLTNCSAKPSRQESEEFVSAGKTPMARVHVQGKGGKITMGDRVQIPLPPAYPLPAPRGLLTKREPPKNSKYMCGGHNNTYVI